MVDETKRSDITQVVILSGWSLALLACVSVVTVALYKLTLGQSIEGTLKEWAGMCLVFLFTNFLPIVKEFISK